MRSRVLPKGKKRTIVEGREWLSRYERGEPLLEIAQLAGRATSTVWTGIRSARVEREEADVRKEIASNAYERHFGDLLTVAGRLVDQPESSVSEIEFALLVDSLRAHMPNSSLWVSLRHRDRCIEKLRDAEKAMANAAEIVIESGAHTVTSILNRDGVSASLRFATDMVSKKQSISHMRYERSGGILNWGAYALSSDNPNDALLDELQHRHGSWIMAAVDSDNINELREAREALDRAKDSLALEVAKLRLRRVFAGTCELCPGHMNVPGRRSRRRRGGQD